VLACAEAGATNAAVAQQMRVSEDTVSKWRGRFARHRLGGLDDRQRAGRPKVRLVLSDDERAQLGVWVRRASTAQSLALREDRVGMR
jgi:transposase